MLVSASFLSCNQGVRGFFREVPVMQMGKILFAVHQGTYVLKLEGEVRVPLCASLDLFLERMFRDERLGGVFIDLSDSSMVDSTTLGLLAKISVFLQSHAKEKAVILSTQEDVTRILKSMGFERVFVILENQTDYDHEDLAEMPVVNSSDKEVTHRVIEAHRTLMAMNNENHQTFLNLVEALENGQLHER